MLHLWGIAFLVDAIFEDRCTLSGTGQIKFHTNNVGITHRYTALCLVTVWPCWTVASFSHEWMLVNAVLTLFWSSHISGEVADILKHWAFQWSALLKCDKMDVWAQPGGKHDPISHLMDWQSWSWGSWATVNCWAKMLSQHFHHQNNRAQFSDFRLEMSRRESDWDMIMLVDKSNQLYCQCWKFHAHYITRLLFSNNE